MKKQAIIFLSMLIGAPVYAQINSVPNETPTIKMTNVEKSKGKRKFLGLFGPVLYSDVYVTSDVYYVTNPSTGISDRVVVTTLHCENKGDEYCRKAPGNVSIEECTNSIDLIGRLNVDAYMDTLTNQMLDIIDGKVMDDSIYSGSHSFTRAVESFYGTYYFSALATWRNGNADGDAIITVVVRNITDEMQNMLH